MKYQLADFRATPPTSTSYWVLPNRLLAGAYPGRPDPAEHQARIHALVDAGIRQFLNLMEEHEIIYNGEPFVPYLDIAAARGQGVHMIRHAIRDLSVPTPTRMTAILDAIDGALAADQPTYVHCWGGVGRTGTVIGCWLLRHDLATRHNVLDVLRELRQQDQERRHRVSPEMEGQQRFVKKWPAGSARARG